MNQTITENIKKKNKCEEHSQANGFFVLVEREGGKEAVDEQETERKRSGR